MEKSEDIYWLQWQKLIEAAANFQELLTGSVMIGGSAVALHLKHRYSFDADHILFGSNKGQPSIADSSTYPTTGGAKTGRSRPN